MAKCFSNMRLLCAHVFAFLLIRNFCVSQFHQDDYDLIHDRCDVIRINKTAAPIVEIKLFKYNNTLIAKVINFTMDFKPGLHKNMLVGFIIYKQVRNIYRQIPAMNFTLDICEEYRKIGDRNPFGIQTAIQASNFRGCPVAPGVFYIDTWYLDQEKLPPHLPSGEYRLDAHFVVDDDIFVFDAECYGAVHKRKKNKKH